MPVKMYDASRLAIGNEKSRATLVLPALAASELSILQIEPEDASVEEVLAECSQLERPVIISLPQQSGVFSHEQDFSRVKESTVDIISFLIPPERTSAIWKFAYDQGFHFTSELAKAEEVFLQRQQQDCVPVGQAYRTHFPQQREDTMQQPDNSPMVGSTASQPQNVTETDRDRQKEWSGRENPVTPLPEPFRAETFTFPTAAPAKKKRQTLAIVAVVVLLIVVSAGSLPLLLKQPAAPGALTVPQQPTTASASSGLVNRISFLSSGQLDPSSSTGLNDIVSLSLAGIAQPQQNMSYYAWLLSDKTQDGISPILLGKLQVVEGKVQLSYQDPHHTDLLTLYSRFLVTEEGNDTIPTAPPLDAASWRYQAGIADVPTPGDEKGYSLLSHLRHLLAKDPTLQQIGLQGGLDIWLFRNMGKVFEWSSAARDDWASPNTDLLRRLADRIVQYLDGQANAFRDLPPGTPWLVDPKDGRPGLIALSTAPNGTASPGPPDYISHVQLHLMGLVNSPGHTEAQRQLANKIDAALFTIATLLQGVRTDAVALANLSDAQVKQPAALSLLDDMLTKATDAYIGLADPNTGAVFGGEVWVHNELHLLASFPVTTATPNGP